MSRGIHTFAPPELRLGTLERLPKWLNLIPMVLQWAWLGMRYGSLTLPTCANPGITAGGMVGDGKMEYFAAMGPTALAATVQSASFVCRGSCSAADVEAQLQLWGVDYPIVLKPDLGWCGFGVRKIDGHGDLRAYLDAFPQGQRVVVQPYLGAQYEAGLFYLRSPHESQGRLLGMLLRHYPRVVGDGMHTVSELLSMDPRAKRLRGAATLARLDARRVLHMGETLRLASVCSIRVGGSYVDGSTLITPALTHAIDAIAKDMGDFHVGRFDVKFDQLARLQKGEGFKIIEVNGAGSEAVHAWDARLTLRQAYAIVFDKQRRLFALGAALRQQGHRPIGPWKLLWLHIHQQRLIARYPDSN